MNEGVLINLEYWIQIITAIAALSSINLSFNLTTDMRIHKYQAITFYEGTICLYFFTASRHNRMPPWPLVQEDVPAPDIWVKNERASAA